MRYIFTLLMFITLLHPTIVEAKEPTSNNQTYEEILSNFKTSTDHASKGINEKEKSWVYDLPEMNRQNEVDPEQILALFNHKPSKKTLLKRNIIGGIKNLGTQIENSWLSLNMLGLKYTIPNTSEDKAKQVFDMTGRYLTSIRQSQQEIMQREGIDTQSFAFLISAFITSFILGMIPIIIIRYLSIQQPINVNKANWIAAINSLSFWIVFNGITLMNGGKSGIGFVWLFVFFTSTKILSHNHNKINIDELSNNNDVISTKAEENNMNAQYLLGESYRLGKDMPTDLEESFKWYKKAAEQGHIEAQVSVGSMYAGGYGVQQDYTEAFSWYNKAAKKKHSEAQFILGKMYELGQGTTKNYKEAIKYYTKSAENRNIEAQSLLGEIYDAGKITPQDYTQSYIWYSLAAINGDKEAILNRDEVANKLSSEQLVQTQSLTKKYYSKYSRR